jgi:3-oxoacyl-[acyl-carrier-protein] synthase II
MSEAGARRTGFGRVIPGQGGSGREVWVTGIGLLSSLGEGLDAHWQALSEAPRPMLDHASLAPFAIHPLVAVDYDRQIPRKGDQRQMEPWQRIGTYAAGLALDDAGVARDAALLARTHMIVAAGGGERDPVVDLAIATTLAASNAPTGPELNARLAADLRPTLFLAQLSNLLAGSISIVHGVRGSSRTFMGEESAGADAMRVAHARLRAGQAEIALIGGAFNAARHDLLILYGAGAQVRRGGYAPVWQRTDSPGFIGGSMGAFVVLEARSHAEARGARGHARLVDVVCGMAREDRAAAAAALWHTLPAPADAVLSGATGAEPATAAERHFLAGLPAIRATGSLLGHGVEAQFPANVALAALALSRGGYFPAFDASGVEAPCPAPPRRVLVTGFGQRRGEALALLERIAP